MKICRKRWKGWFYGDHKWRDRFPILMLTSLESFISLFLLIFFSVIVMLETVKKMMKHKETFFDFILNYKLILFISGCLLKVFSTKARNYINWLELWAQTWNPTSTSRGDTRLTLRETHSPYFIAEFHRYSEPQQRHIIPKVTHWKSAMRNDLVYAVGDSVSAYSVCS